MSTTLWSQRRQDVLCEPGGDSQARWDKEVLAGEFALPAYAARCHGALRGVNLPEVAFERALHAAGYETEHDVLTRRLELNGRITLAFKPSGDAQAHRR